MSLNMKLWRIDSDKPFMLSKSQLDTESRLEKWLGEDNTLLGINLLLIGNQVNTTFGGRIDFLAIDEDGDLVIIELKRNRTPREVVAQVLDYASWVKDLSLPKIEEICKNYRGKSLGEEYGSFFNNPLPETVNNHHRMIIVASEIDEASERIVQYLSTEYNVDLNVIFFNFFKDGARELLGRSWLMDPEEVSIKSESKKTTPWTGFYFVNVGEGPHRNWDDCVKYGFISAGQGRWYSTALNRLRVGDKIFAYMVGKGYVGYGVVNKEASIVSDFVVTSTGELLSSVPLVQNNIFENQDNPEMAEWLVSVKWEKTFSRDKGKWKQGLFANQNIVCKLRDNTTYEFLRTEFEVADD